MSGLMEQPGIFRLAAMRGQWLALRQSAIASNVAHATTPGYVAKDVGAFNAVLDRAGLELATTDTAHFGPTGIAAPTGFKMRAAAKAWDVSPTGNSVSLDQEIAKAGDNAKDFALETGVVRSLHRMWISALKGVTMNDPLLTSLHVAGAGLAAQSTRLRVVSENIANANSTSAVPGGDPYARKTITFASELDRLAGADFVRVAAIGTDKSAFRLEHDPSNPGADASGNVKMPNVNMLVEMADMREANRAYEANVQVIKEGRELLGMTIDLLRSNA